MSDFWAKKLGMQPEQPQQRQSTPMPPSQQPMTQMPQPVQQAPRTPAGVRSASQTATCPDCGSDKYMSVQGAKARCMDCGYPIEQSGGRFGALTGAQVVGNAKEARGNDTTNNYNPQTIIGRL